MADIFISYKKEDVLLTERIASALQGEGFSVWWDDGLTPREAWDATIEHEIAAAAAVVVLWTPRAVLSDWVRTEAHYAQDRGKLIPVLAEPCSIPIAFMLRQTVSLAGWQGERTDKQWRKLLTWIADITATKLGNANLPQALGTAQPNRFRDAVGFLSSGDPIVDGALINSSTPALTAFRDGEHMPVMRILPSGAFVLGSPAADPDRMPFEGPQKRIEIPAPFAMSVFPVPVGEYRALMGSLPSALAQIKQGTPAAAFIDALAPVTYVSFDDAQAFTARLSTETGEAYRVPSETEWEYACRASSRGRYAGGDTIDASRAVFAPATGPRAVGSFSANAFGLYDMHGNVREWTADLWHESYDATPSDGSPAIEGHGSMRVVRGGGWSDGAAMLRSAARMRGTQSSRVNVIGFRIVRALT
ncbi:MAG: SUMF1/EgtB/PvdO family nonheme iron enzyme [Janthinobacterium lividum]